MKMTLWAALVAGVVLFLYIGVAMLHQIALRLVSNRINP